MGDAEIPAGDLTVTATSSNADLVPDGNLILGGSGADRTITATPLPDSSGSATITLTVSDGTAQTQTSFLLTVDPVNDAPTVISPIADVDVAEDAADEIVDLAGVFEDIDDASLTLSVAGNTNPSLVTTDLTGETLTLSFTPDANGNADLTIEASDGQAAVTDGFTVTVTPENDAPTITAVADQTIDEDTDTGALAFTIGDAETPAGDLTVTATSTIPTSCRTEP